MVKASLSIKKYNYLALVAFLLIGCEKTPDESSKKHGKLTVEVAKVKQGDFPIVLDVVGTTFPNQTVRIKARLDSRIEAIKFTDGDFVKEGQLLFLLDDRQLKAQLQQAEATLKQQEAQLHLAELNLKRSAVLLPKGFVTQQQYDTLNANFKTAEANRDATIAQIENLNTQLSYTTINAPISGRAGTINLTIGNTVKSLDTDENALVTINEISPLKIQLPIPQRFYERLKKLLKSGPVHVDIKDSERKVIDSGVIEYSENEIDQDTRNIFVWAEVPNSQESLWPGMFVDAYIKMESYKDALIVPLSAVQQGQSGTKVYLVRNGKIKKEKVTIQYSDNKNAVIKGRLKEGETIVIGGFLKLKDGLEVTPKLVQTNKVPKK